MVMLMRNYKSWILVGAVLILPLLLGACTPAAPLPTTTPSPAPTPSPTPSGPEETPLKPPITPSPTPAPASTPPCSTTADEFERTFKCHFGFMPAMWDFEGARAAGGAYDRPFFELFQWE